MDTNPERGLTRIAQIFTDSIRANLCNPCLSLLVFIHVHLWFKNYILMTPKKLSFFEKAGYGAAADAVRGYRATTSIVVGILFAICTVLLLGYKLNKRSTIEMADELAARRQKAASA